MSRPPLEQLDAFVIAARLGNLTRAAEAMHLTVSALSHRMRLLEERVGHPLLARGPRGVALTPQGQQLYDAVAGPIDAIGHALRRLGARTGNLLTLSLIPSMATAWLVPRLPAFLARHPELGLSLQASTHVVDFDREPVDAALRLGGGKWPGVTAEFLFDEWITPVASPDFIARHGKPALAAIPSLPLLGDPAARWRDWFSAYGGSAPTRYVASFDDTETLHQAAVQGLGIALARQTLAQPLIDSGRLVPLTRKRLKAEFAHYLVYPQRSLSLPGFQTLRRWLLEQAGARAAPSGKAE